MTPNRSFNITVQLQKFMRTDFLPKIDEAFPYELIANHEEENGKPKRDRVYNEERTLLTMLLTAAHEDKSLQQSVNLFKQSFEARSKEIKNQEAIQLQQEREEDERNLLAGKSRKPGRPKLYNSKMPRSKEQEISDNTAAYTKARARLSIDLVNKVFEYTTDFQELNGKKWHGMVVFLTDGTYIQLQDTEELREQYPVYDAEKSFPQALLQTVIMQGSGQVYDFKIGTRKQSELELVKPLADKLPAGSLLLADDLYNTYAIFCQVMKNNVHIIVPGKRKRKCRIIKTVGKGDEIVEIYRPMYRSPLMSQEEWLKLPQTVIMRKITFPSLSDQKESVLYTTLMDEEISSTEIVLKYFTRWDIEITIREIKTIMGINIVRGKTKGMVLKEITTTLTAYNMVRKIISESVDKTDFSPQGHFLQECFEINTELFVDKKGRVYNRWSPGRPGKATTANPQKVGAIQA